MVVLVVFRGDNGEYYSTFPMQGSSLLEPSTRIAFRVEGKSVQEAEELARKQARAMGIPYVNDLDPPRSR
jgi:hypothetical protein